MVCQDQAPLRRHTRQKLGKTRRLPCSSVLRTTSAAATVALICEMLTRLSHSAWPGIWSLFFAFALFAVASAHVGPLHPDTNVVLPPAAVFRATISAENASCSQLLLCLSRACLGKKIVCIQKQLKQRRFPRTIKQAREAALISHLRTVGSTVIRTVRTVIGTLKDV